MEIISEQPEYPEILVDSEIWQQTESRINNTAQRALDYTAFTIRNAGYDLDQVSPLDHQELRSAIVRYIKATVLRGEDQD